MNFYASELRFKMLTIDYERADLKKQKYIYEYIYVLQRVKGS